MKCTFCTSEEAKMVRVPCVRNSSRIAMCVGCVAEHLGLDDLPPEVAEKEFKELSLFFDSLPSGLPS